jgi:uncharacterized protein YxeA
MKRTIVPLVYATLITNALAMFNGYNQNGYNQNGYNQNGYNQNGYNQNVHYQNGYNQNGYNQNGYNQNVHYQSVPFQNGNNATQDDLGKLISSLPVGGRQRHDFFTLDSQLKAFIKSDGAFGRSLTEEEAQKVKYFYFGTGSRYLGYLDSVITRAVYMSTSPLYFTKIYHDFAYGFQDIVTLDTNILNTFYEFGKVVDGFKSGELASELEGRTANPDAATPSLDMFNDCCIRDGAFTGEITQKALEQIRAVYTSTQTGQCICPKDIRNALQTAAQKQFGVDAGDDLFYSVFTEDKPEYYISASFCEMFREKIVAANLIRKVLGLRANAIITNEQIRTFCQPEQIKNLNKTASEKERRYLQLSVYPDQYNTGDSLAKSTATALSKILNNILNNLRETDA